MENKRIQTIENKLYSTVTKSTGTSHNDQSSNEREMNGKQFIIEENQETREIRRTTTIPEIFIGIRDTTGKNGTKQ